MKVITYIYTFNYCSDTISLLLVLPKVIERRIAHDQFVTQREGKTVRLSNAEIRNSTRQTLGVLFFSQLFQARSDNAAKPLNSINHSMLLENLKRSSVTASALNWFTSYLSNRQQYVRISNKLSSPQKMMHGIPQGSIIAPLLFNLYLNDLPSVSNKIESYVDDSNST